MLGFFKPQVDKSESSVHAAFRWVLAWFNAYDLQDLTGMIHDLSRAQINFPSLKGPSFQTIIGLKQQLDSQFTEPSTCGWSTGSNLPLASPGYIMVTQSAYGHKAVVNTKALKLYETILYTKKYQNITKEKQSFFR